MSDEIPVKEIGELLDQVSTKIPKLITSLVSTLYSPESGKSMGQAVGNMYKELIEAGIPKEEALQMAREYIQTIKNVTQSINKD